MSKFHLLIKYIRLFFFLVNINVLEKMALFSIKKMKFSIFF
jgi:hypothetical protein